MASATRAINDAEAAGAKQVAANNQEAQTNACTNGSVFDPTQAKCISIATALSSGLLMQYGAEAGAAVAVHFQAPRGRGASASYATGTAITPMGYVAGFPAYWLGWGEKQRLYCAKSKSISATWDTQQVAKGIAVTNGEVGKKEPSWNCGWGVLGFFVGIPATFQTDTVLNAAYAATNPGSRTLRPLVSFGLAIDPFPWLNFLAGATYSAVQADTIPGAPTGTGAPKTVPPDLKVWTSLVGVGGTFDVASLIIGAK